MWFVALVVGVVVLGHLYVYRRAVHDVLAPGRGRRIAGAVLVGLAAVVLVALRHRDGRQLEPMPIEAAVALLADEAHP